MAPRCHPKYVVVWWYKYSVQKPKASSYIEALVMTPSWCALFQICFLKTFKCLSIGSHQAFGTTPHNFIYLTKWIGKWTITSKMKEETISPSNVWLPLHKLEDVQLCWVYIFLPIIVNNLANRIMVCRGPESTRCLKQAWSMNSKKMWKSCDFMLPIMFLMMCFIIGPQYHTCTYMPSNGFFFVFFFC